LIGFGSVELRDLSVIGRKIFNLLLEMPEPRVTDIRIHAVATRSCPIKPWRKERRFVGFKIKNGRKIPESRSAAFTPLRCSKFHKL
jgi:hypothetical protein